MARSSRGTTSRFLVAAITVIGMIATAAGFGQAAPSVSRPSARELLSGAKTNEAGNDTGSDILRADQQYSLTKTLPAGTVDAAAYLQARKQAAAMANTGGAWSELTNRPYKQEDPRYQDPFWSNAGVGWGIATGRATALVASGNTVYAGFADGGVWKSTDRGAHWAAVGDNLPSTSIGAMAINQADHSLWVGTGEFNTAAENYRGTGIYRSTNGGQSWQRVGGSELDSTLVSALAFDWNGHVFASTQLGVLRHSTTDMSSPWIPVLQPGSGPYDITYTNDVKVQPGTNGKTIIASLGWRSGPTEYNGFWVSNQGGTAGTWHKVHTMGALRSNQIGRGSFAYSADGSKLYAVVESWKALLYKGYTALYGIFVSPSGNVEGPWKLKAGWKKLTDSGSALGAGQGYSPGVQAWYNQVITVDPGDPNHVYVGLEEVYETKDGGATWNTIGPYWNYGLPCGSNCPMTTHPDQHAMAIANGVFYEGNDGGIWTRSLGGSRWTDRNYGLDTLQYYYAGIGHTVAGDMIWGGLQDNGESLILPGEGPMVNAFTGDGGDTLVDPNDGNRAVVEYVDLNMVSTTDAGHHWTQMTPSCYAYVYTPDPCDPNPRFIAPFRADIHNADHWVAGGEFVWETTKGFDTTCSATACDWTPVHDTGADTYGIPNTTTAIGVSGNTIYAGWCGGGCNPGVFESGIDTNYGGTWHRVADATGNGGAALPQRYINAITVDPNDPAHIWAVYGGFSRRWIASGGVGHVFESTNGGATWTDVSGNLPDAPADDLVVVNDMLVLATDVGVFIADPADPSNWSSFGSGLPNVVPNDLTVSPDGSYIVAATHGRGLWSIPSP